MIASDIMTREPLTVAPDTPLADVVRLLLDHRLGALPVVEGTSVVGMVGEADLLRRLGPASAPRASSWLGLFASDASRAGEFVHAHGKLTRDIMAAPAVTVAEETPAEEIAELLETHGFGQVPVVRAGSLVGVVSRSDLLRALAGRLATPPARRQDDAGLHAAVVAAIETSGWLEGTADLTIQVEDGTVALWGTFADPDIRRALVVRVGEVPGVRQVRDQLVPAHNPDPLDLPNWPSPARP
jgi:CBS domain-containing protein